MGWVSKEEERLLMKINEITADVAAVKAENDRLISEVDFLRGVVNKIPLPLGVFTYEQAVELIQQVANEFHNDLLPKEKAEEDQGFLNRVIDDWMSRGLIQEDT